jgi:hypothetical protein
MTLHGGCMCGAVRFELSAPLLGAVYCHCKRCQRRTGSGFSVSGLAQPGSFTLVQGSDVVRAHRPADGWHKSYCGLPRTTHPRSLARRQTPRGFRRSLLPRKRDSSAVAHDQPVALEPSERAFEALIRDPGR